MLRFLKFTGYAIIALVITACLGILFSDNSYIFPALLHNYADIDDYRIFENRRIPKSTNPQPWALSQSYNQEKLNADFLARLEAKKTVAFLVIKNDSLQFEQYWDGYSDSSFSNSFSMAKSYVSVLTGIALKEGKIKSIDQPVSDFIPEYSVDARKNIRIRNLLTMSSGLDWNEAYTSLFSITTKAYYGNDLHKSLLAIKSIEKPGERFEYKSGDTQILSFVLEKATGTKLSDYLHEKLWQPLGCTQDALWCLDKKNGHEKAYCCINSNARDFAKLGKLYLQQGNWNGKQLVDSSYVKSSLSPTGMMDAGTGEKVDFYGYSWWIIPDYKGHKIFYARGILGQYMIVIPDQKIIAVRLGNLRGKKVGHHIDDVYDISDEILRLYGS